MTQTITLRGKIVFEPEDKTKKHVAQSSWKKMAMVMFYGEVTEYYAWFINKRYNLQLNRPLRGGHISFINDSINDMSRKNGRTIEETNNVWNEVKAKWDGKYVDVVLDLSPRTDDRMWWLNIPKEHRAELHAIRSELGLGEPVFGLHMSIGYANEKHINHSAYIHELIKIGLIC